MCFVALLLVEEVPSVDESEVSHLSASEVIWFGFLMVADIPAYDCRTCNWTKSPSDSANQTSGPPQVVTAEVSGP